MATTAPAPDVELLDAMRGVDAEIREREIRKLRLVIDWAQHHLAGPEDAAVWGEESDGSGSTTGTCRSPDRVLRW